MFFDFLGFKRIFMGFLGLASLVVFYFFEFDISFLAVKLRWDRDFVLSRGCEELVY